MKFRLIEAEKAEHRISRLCKVLGVTAAGYYAWRRRGPSLRSLGDAELERLIVEIYDGSFGIYGAPRIHAELADGDGVRVGRKRVARLMRTLELQGSPAAARSGGRRFPIRRRRLSPTWSSGASSPSGPTSSGWPTWSMRDDLKADLVVDALAMAIARRRPQPGLIHHSDRGSQPDEPRLRQDAQRVRARRLDGLTRRRLRQRPERELPLDDQGGMDQAPPLPDARPGAALDLPLHRDVL